MLFKQQGASQEDNSAKHFNWLKVQATQHHAAQECCELHLQLHDMCSMDMAVRVYRLSAYEHDLL